MERITVEADAGSPVGGGTEEKGLVGSCVAGCCGSGATVLSRPSPVDLRCCFNLALSPFLFTSHHSLSLFRLSVFAPFRVGTLFKFLCILAI